MRVDCLLGIDNPQEVPPTPHTLNPEFPEPYRGTSLIRNRPTLGPYSRPMPGALWLSQGCWRFLMSEATLYRAGGRVPSVS